MAMGRAQKYFKRKRYIYALFFDHGAAYIGQSLDPERRAKEHAKAAGGWYGARFRLVVLYKFLGTQEDGERFERMYRLRARRAGLRIYGLPHVYVNPETRSSLRERVLSYFMPWPRHEGRGLVAFFTRLFRAPASSF